MLNVLSGKDACMLIKTNRHGSVEQSRVMSATDNDWIKKFQLPNKFRSSRFVHETLTQGKITQKFSLLRVTAIWFLELRTFRATVVSTLEEQDFVTDLY